MSGKTKVLVIGLDCAGPELVFDRFKDELPNLSAMMDNGIYGELESCHPPITIPAWAVMFTGKNLGKLGLYGFRHRKENSYTDFYIATSQFVREPAVWDIASKYGKKSCVVGVPPSYPPKPLNGYMISCFITPDTAKDYTYPSSLRYEVERLVGKYVFDVEFRTEERKKLLRELYDMTEKRFKVLRHLMLEKPWDLFIFVEIGVGHLLRVAWIARLLARNGTIVLCSFVSPYRSVRAKIRKIVEEEVPFIEVFVRCSLEEAMRRDPKGL